MKRILTTLSFALFFASIQLYGQTLLSVCESAAMPARGETYFGIKGGLNLSKLGKSSGINSSSLRSGMHAGVYFGYMLADGFSVQPELMYSRQGGKVQEGFTRRLDYINLPVMLHYMLPSSMLSGFYLELGPQIGFLVSTRLKGPEGEKLPDEFKKPMKDANKFDFALAGGLGYHFNKNWNASARYAQGFNSTLKNTSNGKQRNSVVQLGLGYTF